MAQRAGPYGDYGAYPYADVFNFADVTRAPTDDFYGITPEVQKLIDTGAIKRSVQHYQNETGEGDYYRDVWDMNNPAWNDLPKATLPTIAGGWSPIVQGDLSPDAVYDPSAIFVDPNYGRYTPTRNIRPPGFEWLDLVGPIAMAAISLGAGAIAGGAAAAGVGAAAGDAFLPGALAAGANTTPWYIPAGLSVAKQVGSGVPTVEGLATSLLPGLRELGIPGEAVQAVQGAKAGFDFWKSQEQQPTIQEQERPISSFYNPQAFGDMGVFGDMAMYGSDNGGGYNVQGSMPAVGDGSERVASAIAPGAYSNSYNQVNT